MGSGRSPTRNGCCGDHPRMAYCLCTFGSNLGDKKKFLDDGIQGLRDTPSCEVEAVSEYLVTEPYGGVEQDEFLNGVLKLRTLLTPEELLDRLHKLERPQTENVSFTGDRVLLIWIFCSMIMRS